MSEKVLCEKSDLVAIADAVREATGSAENYNVSELSAATVEAISAGGSGGNVETCTVTLTIAYEKFTVGLNTRYVPMVNNLVYIDGSNAPVHEFLSVITNPSSAPNDMVKTISVLKNSLIVLGGVEYAGSVSGGVSQVGDLSDCYVATDDGAVSISNSGGLESPGDDPL